MCRLIYLLVGDGGGVAVAAKQQLPNSNHFANARALSRAKQPKTTMRYNFQRGRKQTATSNIK